MGKEAKTNAVRILERNKVPYELITYECDEFIDGMHTVEMTGAPVEQTYKTLVMQGKSKQYYVFVIPIAEEVDLKAAARSVGEKSVEMIHVKDLTAITGYVRGGCSPLGMKKAFTTVIDSSAEQFDTMYVSGGRIGTTIKLNPQDLAKVVRASFAPILMHACWMRVINTCIISRVRIIGSLTDLERYRLWTQLFMRVNFGLYLG